MTQIFDCLQCDEMLDWLIQRKVSNHLNLIKLLQAAGKNLSKLCTDLY